MLSIIIRDILLSVMGFIYKYSIPITVAFLTAFSIYVYPFFTDGSPASASSFRSVFGQFAVVSFAIYVILYHSFLWLTNHFRFSSWTKYSAHFLAFLIGYSLLYFLYLSLGSLSNFGTIQKIEAGPEIMLVGPGIMLDYAISGQCVHLGCNFTTIYLQLEYQSIGVRILV